MASEDSATTGTAASAASIFSRFWNASAFMLGVLLSQLKLWSTCAQTLFRIKCYQMSVFRLFCQPSPFFNGIGLVRGFCELSCRDDNVIRCPFSVYFVNRLGSTCAQTLVRIKCYQMSVFRLFFLLTVPFSKRLVWYEVSVNSPASA